MPYKVLFMGLITFFELRGERGRLVLIPDGRPGMKPEFDPGEEIDPHHAAFIVEKSEVVDASRWKGSRETRIRLGDKEKIVVEFPIDEPSGITLSGMVKASNGTDLRTFDDKDFEAKCIKLKDAVDIDPELARTIAKMPIRQGTLESRRVQNTLAAVLSVPNYKGDVIITVWPSGNTATFVDGAEIVLVNWSGNLKGTVGEEKNHFRLYAQLDREKRANNLKNLASQLANRITSLQQDRLLRSPEIVSTHPFVQMVQNARIVEVPETQCTVTGCCDDWMCAKKWAAEAGEGAA